jgi:virginiamycin B lyase
MLWRPLWAWRWPYAVLPLLLLFAAGCSAPLTSAGRTATPGTATPTRTVVAPTPTPTITTTEFPPIAGGAASLVVASDGNLWFETKGAIARMTPSGAITRFAVFPDARGLTIGPDHNLWFFQGVGTVSAAITRMSLSGAMQHFPLPQSLSYGYQLDVSGLTAAPDGALWVDAQGSVVFNSPTGGSATGTAPTRIARISTSGAIQVFTAPWSGQCALVGQCLVAGPDGNLWFAFNQQSYTSNPTTHMVDVSASHGFIGRLSPAGVFAKFSLSNPAATVSALTAGHDGALWFLASQPSAGVSQGFGRITPDGTMHIFPIDSSSGATPSALLAGSDGNMWFTDSPGVDGSPGRVTPSGDIQVFDLPPGHITAIHLDFEENPSAMVLGPDGAIWFTQRLRHAIERVTPDGQIEQFELPQTEYPIDYLSELVTGPGNAIWYVHNPYSKDMNSSPGSIIGRIAFG